MRRSVCVFAAVMLGGCGIDWGADEGAPDTSSVTQAVTAGKHPPCAPNVAACIDMHIVAHEDDDILFMNPDISTSIENGNQVVTVFLTAGSNFASTTPSGQPTVCGDGRVSYCPAGTVDGCDGYAGTIYGSCYDNWTGDPKTSPSGIGEAHFIDRELSALNAYSYMAGSPNATSDNGALSQQDTMLSDWSRSVQIYGDHEVVRYDYIGTPNRAIQLIFFRLQQATLAGLWATPGATATTFGCNENCPFADNFPNPSDPANLPDSVTYNREQLINGLVAILNQFQASIPDSQLVVSTQDSTLVNTYAQGWATYNDEHDWVDNPDHVWGAHFAISAFHQYHRLTNSAPRTLREYRGYDATMEPVNLVVGAGQQAKKARIFLANWVMNGQSFYGDPNSPSGFGIYDEFLARQYSTLSLASANPLQGRLMNGSMTGAGECLRLDSGLLHTGSCTGAPEWLVTTRNEIRLATDTSQYVYKNASNSSYSLGSALALSEADRQTLALTSNGQIRTLGAGCLHGSTSSVYTTTCAGAVVPQCTTGSQCGSGVCDTIHGVCQCATTSECAPGSCVSLGHYPNTPKSGQCTGNFPLREPVPGQNWTLLLSNPQLTSTQFADTSEVDDARSYYRTLTIQEGQICLRRPQGVGCAPYYKGQRDYLTSTTALSLTAGGSTIGSGNTQSSTFVVAQTVKRSGISANELPAPSAAWLIHYAISTMSTPYEMRLKLRHLNAAGAVLSESSYGAVRSAVGTYDDNIVWTAGTWNANDQLALIWEHRRPSGTGNKNAVVTANGASYVDPLAQLLPFAYWAQASSEYMDGNGWLPEEYGSTIVFGRPTGSAPLKACGRGFYGMYCGQGSVSTSWWYSYFGNSGGPGTGGWSAPSSRYGSIRLADVSGDGNADVCGKIDNSIYCGISTGTTNPLVNAFMNPILMSVETGIQYGEQMSFGDINGDGFEEPCGRSQQGMSCMISEGAAFRETKLWSANVGNNALVNTRDFGDSDPASGWGLSGSQFMSVRLVDINRDGLSDVCGRGSSGIFCSLSTGMAFERKRNVMPFDFTDILGWNSESRGGTLRFGDLDGDARVDFCARGIAGMWCGEGH